MMEQHHFISADQTTADLPLVPAGEEASQQGAHLRTLIAEGQRLDREVRQLRPAANSLFGYALATALFLSSILWLMIVLWNDANDESLFGAGLSLLVASAVGCLAALIVSRNESKKARERVRGLQAAARLKHAEIDAARRAGET